MPVYVFERITITGGGRGRFIDLIRRKWAPHAEAKHGVKLAGLWATAGSTAAWPEANILWEMDDWAHFAAASQAQHPMEEKDTHALELWRQALDWRSGGVSSLLAPARFSPTSAQHRASGVAGPVFLFEKVRTLPGKMEAYHAAIEAEYLHVAMARGLRLFGAYRHAIQPNLGFNIWALKGWDHARGVLESEESDHGVVLWRRRCAGLLEDQAAWLIVTPPEGALRT